MNSGQVGSLRAALFISKRYQGNPKNNNEFVKAIEVQVQSKLKMAKAMITENQADADQTWETRSEIQERMSACGAHIRSIEKVKPAIQEAWDLYSKMKKEMKVVSAKELPAAFQNLDLCLTHALYLEAIAEYLEKGGKSRGSYLVMDSSGKKSCEKLSDEWKFSLNQENNFVNQKVLEIWLDDHFDVKKQWVDVRPIPQEDSWFENVWNEYLSDKIVR